MGCFDECIGSMMEPYGGNTPLFGGNTTDATVTIVQEAYDDGMKVTRIQTPPRTETSVLMEAINNILGMVDPMMSSLMPKEDKKPDEKQKGGDEDDHVRSEPESQDKPKSDSKPFGQDKQSGFGQDNKQEGMVDKD